MDTPLECHRVVPQRRKRRHACSPRRGQPLPRAPAAGLPSCRKSHVTEPTVLSSSHVADIKARHSTCRLQTATASHLAARNLGTFVFIHPGVELRANLKRISHRCLLFEVAFVWELSKETIHLPLGCLQGGLPARCSPQGLMSLQVSSDSHLAERQHRTRRENVHVRAHTQEKPAVAFNHQMVPV